MFSRVENLKVINAFAGISIEYKEFQNRSTHAFIYKINGKSEYQFGREKIELNKHEILFIPAGSDYTVRKICREESKYIVVNFTAELENGQPSKYIPDTLSDIEAVFREMAKRWLFPDTTNYYMCMSLMYRLFSLISQSGSRTYCSRQQRNKLKPAVEYLQEHIFDCDLKIEILHTLCGISDTYFRKLFIAEYGVSPKQYISGRRLAQAKYIIDNGDCTYVHQVAESVGYTDALYFSKAFKRQYGYAPSLVQPSFPQNEKVMGQMQPANTTIRK